MKDDNFIINVVISGTRLPLNIPRKDEELYRKAERLVNKHLDHYQKQYNQRSIEEILIYVAFHIAVIVSKQELRDDEVPMAEKIQQLDNELKLLFSEQ
ncbi:MAG: cell division protein ZapA [Paludibacter sp.]